ncbi:MAG: uridine kinase, partial [Lachnospiraceae bacterium]|nr:uridine kinase [Lachnospiraceae bacterium]
MRDRIVIGVAGGSASGKTTVATRVTREFDDGVLLLSHDSYYNAHDEMPFEERAKINYDHPNAFETQRLIRDIKALKNGESIDIPVYDFANHNRSKETVHIEPKQVIVVEGILVFENKELRDMMDIRIFVDTDADERLVRRIRRDVSERGRTLESVLNQYITTVKPMHEQFVEPSKR